MELPKEIEWNIMKFMSHPVADLVKERIKCHNISIDRNYPFHVFHFYNTAYCYDYLAAEWRRENEYHLMEEDMAEDESD